jgi:hypothetical protein
MQGNEYLHVSDREVAMHVFKSEISRIQRDEVQEVLIAELVDLIVGAREEYHEHLTVKNIGNRQAVRIPPEWSGLHENLRENPLYTYLTAEELQSVLARDLTVEDVITTAQKRGYVPSQKHA